MTQDEIIRMARELATRHGSRMCDEDGETHGEELYCVGVEDIEEIIKQVAAHERKQVLANDDSLTLAYMVGISEGRLAEREACAKVCEQDEFQIYETAERCAAAIRARGNNK